jgi:hypothetical protein
MKPIKRAVALVIKNKQGEFLTVKRPEDETGPLAGVWGFPAITLYEGENEIEAARRVGRFKLGAIVEVGDKIGERTDDRGEYILHLSDYEADFTQGSVPKVPQPDTSVTQYTDLKYTDNPKVLLPAAQKGSLCSQVYLNSTGISWDS